MNRSRRRERYKGQTKFTRTKVQHKPTGMEGADYSQRAADKFVDPKTDLAGKLAAAEKYIEIPSVNQNKYCNIGGAMLLELALRDELTEAKRQSLFERARRLIQLSAFTPGNELPTLKSRLLHANIDIYQSFTRKQTPSPEVLDLAYIENVKLAKDLVSLHPEPANDKHESSTVPATTRDITGLQSELFTLTLLQRFERRELNDGTWIALPSMYSEDNSPKNAVSKKKRRNSWDVSGYVKVDPADPFELAYQIQVKSGTTNPDRDRKKEEEAYEDHIIFLDPGADLANPGYSTPSSRTGHQSSIPTGLLLADIIEELRVGGEHYQATPRLDFRTETLLDILG